MIGRPLEECAACGDVVLRSGTTEWELLRASQRLDLIARRGLVALAIGLAAPVLYWAATRAQGIAWQPLHAALCLAVGWAIAGTWQGSRLAAAIRRSRRRMSDPMYLAMLMQHQLAAPQR